MLKSVAVGNTVFRSNILMLLGVVFVGFHDANPGEPFIVKRAVMTTSTKSIQTIHHHRVHFWHKGLGGAMYISCQLS